ncbi:hypothetical protein EIP86_001638 [Pleurotus ostreatoroseus]|nr:hypothetical protein EIP86_001638 [Pleurotus ostreatoroseus]
MRTRRSTLTLTVARCPSTRYSRTAQKRPRRRARRGLTPSYVHRPLPPGDTDLASGQSARLAAPRQSSHPPDDDTVPVPVAGPALPHVNDPAAPAEPVTTAPRAEVPVPTAGVTNDAAAAVPTAAQAAVQPAPAVLLPLPVPDINPQPPPQTAAAPEAPPLPAPPYLPLSPRAFAQNIPDQYDYMDLEPAPAAPPGAPQDHDLDMDPLHAGPLEVPAPVAHPAPLPPADDPPLSGQKAAAAHAHPLAFLPPAIAASLLTERSENGWPGFFLPSSGYYHINQEESQWDSWLAHQGPKAGLIVHGGTANNDDGTLVSKVRATLRSAGVEGGIIAPPNYVDPSRRDGPRMLLLMGITPETVEALYASPVLAADSCTLLVVPVSDTIIPPYLTSLCGFTTDEPAVLR